MTTETWAEGVYEGPPCLHPHAGGGGGRCPAEVSHPGRRLGHEPDGDRQIFAEGCSGDLNIKSAIVND